MKRVMILLTIVSVGALALAQQPVPVLNQTPYRPAPETQITVLPAPVTVQVVQPKIPVILIDPWGGYHHEAKIAIAVNQISSVRPHIAAPPGGENHVGSGIHMYDEGIWYTKENPTALTTRLNALGWGDTPLPTPQLP